MAIYKIVGSLIILFTVLASCQERQKTYVPENNITERFREVMHTNAPDHISRTIAQDHKGNIWIAAFDGIFNYNGEVFDQVTDTVSSARFFGVLEDSRGSFWFSSVGSGVFYFDGHTFLNYTTENGLANNTVTEIYEDRAGNIWFATASGVSQFDGNTFKNYYPIDKDALNNDINTIAQDKDGKMWFGTRGSAYVYENGTFSTVTYNEKTFTNIRKIIEDQNGTIWMGGSDGLWRYDGDVFTKISKAFVGYIYEDSGGNIWSSSENLNNTDWILYRYDASTLSDPVPKATRIEPKAGMIFGVVEATDGSIWFGGLYGVYQYDGNVITHYKKKNPLEN